jgi:hypothetical protein
MFKVKFEKSEFIHRIHSKKKTFEKKTLTISPNRTTFSPLIIKIPRGISPYASPTYIRSIVSCKTKFA